MDASPKLLVIVYTEDATPEADAEAPHPAEGACTKVAALRVDRQTFEESTVELSPGRCGHEVGPFFTSAVGDAVSVAWPERTGGAGQARAPIVALAHAQVGLGSPPKLARIEQAADALVEAGCDGTSCFAAALVRKDGERSVRILRWR